MHKAIEGQYVTEKLTLHESAGFSFRRIIAISGFSLWGFILILSLLHSIPPLLEPDLFYFHLLFSIPLASSCWGSAVLVLFKLPICSMSSCLPLHPCCSSIGSLNPPVELSYCSEFNQIAVRNKFGEKKERKKQKPKRTVLKLLLKIFCWGEMQELSIHCAALWENSGQLEKFMSSTHSRKTLCY